MSILNYNQLNKMTQNQKDLIDDMNEFCKEKLYYNNNTTFEKAKEYISKNIEEYQLEMEALDIGSDWYSRYS